MYHGGGAHGGGSHGGSRLHSALDAEYDDDVLGKAYDNKIIARLPKYLSPVKGWLALGASGMVVRTLAQLAIPAVVALATDRFILAGDLAGLNIVAIIFVF